MFKYGIYKSEWENSKACNARDSNVYIIPDNEYLSIIDILCTE